MPRNAAFSSVLLALTLACGSKPQSTTPNPEASTQTQEPGIEVATIEPSTTVEAAPVFAMPAISSEVAAIVAAPDRSANDREMDEGRKPAELLTFLRLKPGMKVADLMAGFGYTTELLARAVGENGIVYGQNNAFVLQRFAEKGWSEHLLAPAMKKVVRVDRELDDPVPAEAQDLDLVIMVLFYHDTFWQGVDRSKMNAAIFKSLRSKGRFVIIDHSGREGTGSTEVKTLHRIEESVVRQEVEAAGFRLAESADFLRNPLDSRDWDASPRAAAQTRRRGKSDRFILAFEKP
jgi:predicted methyltransferase